MRQREKDNITKQERAQRIIDANEERTCPECGTKFPMTPDDRQDKIFCSKACAGAESKRNYVAADPERRRKQSAQSAMRVYNEMPAEERQARARRAINNMGPRRRAKHSVRTRINAAVRRALNSGKRTCRLEDIDFDVDKYMTHMESLWQP